MYETLLLFDNELDKLKQTGWDYELKWVDEDKKIFVVKVDIPQDVMKHLKLR